MPDISRSRNEYPCLRIEVVKSVVLLNAKKPGNHFALLFQGLERHANCPTGTFKRIRCFQTEKGHYYATTGIDRKCHMKRVPFAIIQAPIKTGL